MVKDHPDSREETHCRHIGYSFRLAARVLLYASSHRQDNTYHGLCYTSRGALAGTRNSSMGPPHEWSIRRPIAPWANALTTELHLAPVGFSIPCVWWGVKWDQASLLSHKTKSIILQINFALLKFLVDTLFQITSLWDNYLHLKSSPSENNGFFQNLFYFPLPV